MHKPGDIIDERYFLVKLLGLRGGAEIWEAEHEVVGRKVTLKLFSGDMARDPALQTRLVAESRAAAQIGHAAAVEVFDVGATAEGEAYLVAEPLRGETLRDLVGRRGHLRAADACHLAREILGGLGAAHRAGIVHGALGPDGIVLRRDPGDRVVLKILDFALAAPPEMQGELAQAGGTHPTSVTERAAPRIGSEPPADASVYLAPEQALGESDDPRSDLYAVGAMLFEMLTGRSPLRAEREAMVVASVPEGLQRIVERAMASAPSSRFVSAREMADALAPFAAQEASLAAALRDSMMPLLSGQARQSRGMARLERAVLGSAPAGRTNLVVIDSARASVRGSAASGEPPDIPLPLPPRAPDLGVALRPFESGHPLRRGYARRARMAGWLRPIVRQGRAPSAALARWLVPALFVLTLCAGVLLARLLRI